MNKDEGRRRVTSGLRIQNGIPDDGENRTDTLPKNTNWESWKSCILRDKESELGGWTGRYWVPKDRVPNEVKDPRVGSGRTSIVYSRFFGVKYKETGRSNWFSTDTLRSVDVHSTFWSRLQKQRVFSLGLSLLSNPVQLFSFQKNFQNEGPVYSLWTVTKDVYWILRLLLVTVGFPGVVVWFCVF